MQISLIIPTYNRVRDLSECLESVLRQTVVPNEVLIIDNSDRDRHGVQKLIEGLKSAFCAKKITLKYIQNREENALTVAKNIGIENSSGEIVSFLDDDIILDKAYYEEILHIYQRYSDALGVEGKIFETNQSMFKYRLSQIIGKFFFLGFREKDKCRLLPSLGVTYLLEDKLIRCEWLSGASTYKRKVFDEFRFDENLKKYSWGEDSDISHRVFRMYPHSLYITPLARYLHKVSPTGRILGKEIVSMEEVYYLYLFFKIIDQTPKNRLIYLWSRLGRMALRIASFLASKTEFSTIKYSLAAIVLCMRNLSKIRSGNLEFFNRTLK